MVEFIRFLKGSVMPQRPGSAGRAALGLKSSTRLSYLPDTEAQRSMALVLGACRARHVWVWVLGLLSAWGPPREQCCLLSTMPRACCRESKRLLLGSPGGPTLARLEWRAFPSHSPPCEGEVLQCLREEILLSRLSTPALPSLIYTIYLLSRLWLPR